MCDDGSAGEEPQGQRWAKGTPAPSKKKRRYGTRSRYAYGGPQETATVVGGGHGYGAGWEKVMAAGGYGITAAAVARLGLSTGTLTVWANQVVRS